jgi:predicted acetyltransferase
MTQLDYGVADEAGQKALVRILARAFGSDEDAMTQWLERAGPDQLRVARRGGTVDAGLLLIPMGQYVGGRGVPMLGVAGVGVRVGARRQGVAVALMTAALREARERGFPLSTLYASNQSLYRRVGYEQSAGCFRGTICPAEIDVEERGLRARDIEESDAETVRAIWRAHASRYDGHLARGPYLWERVRAHRGVPNRGYLLEDEAGRAEAYVYLRARPMSSGFRHALTVTDRAARSPRGWRAIWSLLADHAPMVAEISLHTAPTDPMALLLGEQHALAVALHEKALTRVVDVPRALEDRGYPRGLNARVWLSVEDESLPEAGGHFTLEVEGGRAQVTQGGGGPTVSCGPRGLAAIYSGYISPWTAADAGLIEGPPEALATLAAVFGGAPPWSPDFF